ncbi:MAG TPA: efflux RND transporter periplasmic adaptor subunit, partial [Burkholderiaceae bacterium]|nr:efflux RND transporter periplasmic adaptor subunit [Burkholderiaceae bacterium]
GGAAGPGRDAPIPAAPAASAASGASAASIALPTPEQRQRMLDMVKDDPEQLERRKRFLEALDRGDPAALERWQQQQARRREGGGPTQ